MDHRTLETFLTVLRSGAVGRSAERLNLTQSAVSRRLQALEDELGAKLFVADGRGIKPTALALQLLPLAETAVAAIDQMTTDARGRVNQPTELRLAATPQTIASRIAPAMAAMTGHGLSLTITEAGGAGIGEMVRQDLCDCGISTHPAFETGLQSQPLGVLDLRVVGPALAKSVHDPNPMDLSELVGQKLLLLDGRFQSRKIIDAAFQMRNQRPQVAYEGQSSLAILSLAAAGAGLAVLPSNIRSHLPGRRISFQGQPLTMEVTLMWRQGSRRLDAIQTLRAVLTRDGAPG